MSIKLKKYVLSFLVSTLVIALTIFYSTMASAANNDENVVLYMSFDAEPDGETVMDDSELGNNGTIIGVVSWTDKGKFGGALEFDGASRIEIVHSDSLNLKEEISAEIWFKTDLPQLGRFLLHKAHVGGGRNYEWGLYLTTDSTRAMMYVVEPNDAVGSASVFGQFDDDEWHFLAGTYDGAVITSFCDGEFENIDWSGDIRSSEAPVIIGTWNTNYFSGLLDEAVIYNVALTKDELRKDYVNGFAFRVDSAGKLSSTWAEIKAQ